MLGNADSADVDVGNEPDDGPGRRGKDDRSPKDDERPVDHRGVDGLQDALRPVGRQFQAERRRLALQAALERRAARKAERENPTEQAASGTGEPDDIEAVDLASLDEQTRKLASALLFIGAAAVLWLIWSPVLPAFGVMDSINLWDYPGVVDGEERRIPVTVADAGEDTPPSATALLAGNPNISFFKGYALEGMQRRKEAAENYYRYLQVVRQGEKAQHAHRLVFPCGQGGQGDLDPHQGPAPPQQAQFGPDPLSAQGPPEYAAGLVPMGRVHHLVPGNFLQLVRSNAQKLGQTRIGLQGAAFRVHLPDPLV